MGSLISQLLSRRREGCSSLDEGPLSEQAARVLPTEGESVKSECKRKRRRNSSDGLDLHVFTTCDDNCSSGKSGDVKTLLRCTLSNGTRISSVVGGSKVMDTYGAPLHAYASATPEESHGVCLAWNVAECPLTSTGAVRLCRVANTCRKSVAFLYQGTDGSSRVMEVRFVGLLT